MANKSNHFFIEKNHVKFFNNSEILNSDRTEGVSRRENFILLAAYGFSLGSKTPFENPKNKGNDTFVMNQLTDEELALLYAIAIYDSRELDIVNDDIKVADIAMEYANTGIIALEDIENSSQKDNRIKAFQADINDFIEKL